MTTTTVKQRNKWTHRRVVRVSKPDSERVKRLNISLPVDLYRHRAAVQLKFALPSFSDYVAARLRKDLGLDLPA